MMSFYFSGKLTLKPNLQASNAQGDYQECGMIKLIMENQQLSDVIPQN